jgi:hypothetical protein
MMSVSGTVQSFDKDASTTSSSTFKTPNRKKELIEIVATGNPDQCYTF